jgi:hypothetical protein
MRLWPTAWCRANLGGHLQGKARRTGHDVFRRAGAGGASRAKNLAAPLVTWLGAGFDHAALGQIEAWARSLQDNDLKIAAGLVASNAGRPGSTVTRAMIRASIRSLSSAEKDYARGELVGLISYGYLEADRMRG